MLMFSCHVAFSENNQPEAGEGNVVSTTNQWDKAKSNEVSVTFTLSSAAAKVWSFCCTFLHRQTKGATSDMPFSP